MAFVSHEKMDHPCDLVHFLEHAVVGASSASKSLKFGIAQTILDGCSA